MSGERGRKLFFICALAFAFRLLLFISLLGQPDHAGIYENDSDEYIGMGRALAHGDFLFTSPEASWFPLFRTPGYPAFLAVVYAIGLNDMNAAFLQIIVDTFSCAMVYTLAMRIVRDEKAAMAASFLYAINPLLAVYSFQLLSETLFTALFIGINILFLEFYEKPKDNLGDAAVLGAAFGVLLLIRPIAVAFPPIYAALYYAKRRKAAPPLLLIAIPLLFCGMWMARNLLIEGDFVLSATPTWNMVCYLAGYVAADPAANTAGWEGFIERYGVLDLSKCTNLDYSELKTGADLAMDFVLSNYTVFLKYVIIGFARFFDPVHPAIYMLDALGMVGTTIESNIPLLPVCIPIAAYELGVYYFALSFMLRKDAKERPIVLLFLLLLGYTLLANNAISYSRYRLPLEPFLLIFAAAGMQNQRTI